MRRALLLAVVAGVVAAPAAHADGDPASDVLIGQNVFLPYAQTIPVDLARRISAGVQAANASGYKLKVAIVAGRTDLGLVQGLWLKPKQYAPFLGRELQFVYKGTLVVEMPNGFGVFSASRGVQRERRALDRVTIGPGPKGLGEAMVAAVGRLSPAAAKAAASSGGGSDVFDRVLIGIGAAVLLVALILGGRAVRQRRSATNAG
jgi:hypothetical protein